MAIHPAAPALPPGVAGLGGQGAHPASELCPALGPVKPSVTGHSVHESKQHSVTGVSLQRPKRVAGSRGAGGVLRGETP